LSTILSSQGKETHLPPDLMPETRQQRSSFFLLRSGKRLEMKGEIGELETFFPELLRGTDSESSMD
jgi:hypothetical protein